MDFNDLVEYFERLRATSSRLEMIDILTELFESAARQPNLDEDLRFAVYFTQGRITSEISIEPKLGIAEKQLISIVSEKVGKNIKEIRDIVKQKGDIGEAAQFLLERTTQNRSGLGAFFKEEQSNAEIRPSQKITLPKKTVAKPQKQIDLFNFMGNKDSTSNIIEIPKDLDDVQPVGYVGDGVSLSEIYRTLQKISKISGENSSRDKNKLILGLLYKLSPAGVKYLFNIITGTLRTGASSMSIIDALSFAFTKEKSNRDAIERAYSLLPDLGEIAIILKNKGIQGVKDVKVTLGIPIKMMLASRVPYKEIPSKIGLPFFAEYKYDGERVQVHKKGDKISLFSRHLKNISEMYPDVIVTVKQAVNCEDIVFEGEIVAMDSLYEKMLPFQVVSQRRRKYNVEEMVKKVKVTLFAFDILYLRETKETENGSMVMDTCLENRRKILANIIKNSEALKVSDGKYINSIEEMVEYFKKSRDDGAEGIMNKTISQESFYNPGNRGFLWVKLKGLEGGKMVDTIDLVIIGASYGQGKHKGRLSTIYGAIYNPETDKFESLTRVGSGFDQETLDSLTERLLQKKLEKKPSLIVSTDEPDIWVTPEIIIEIVGDELTESQVAVAASTLNNGKGLSVRFPVFQRFREDKGIKDITTSAEIKEFYDNQ